MSFGYSLGDFVLVSQLAYSVVQNTRKACGAHSALAREVNSLHVVLVRLESEVENERSILNGRSEDGSDVKRGELAGLVRDCERVLRVLKEVLEKVRTGYPYTGWGEYNIDLLIIVQCIISRKAKCSEALATSKIRKWRNARLRQDSI